MRSMLYGLVVAATLTAGWGSARAEGDEAAAPAAIALAEFQELRRQPPVLQHPKAEKASPRPERGRERGTRPRPLALRKPRDRWERDLADWL